MGALFQEESFLPRIFRSSSLNLHTFHLINIVFWWRIFFRKHGKSTPNERQDHHVLVADVVIMTSQCMCTIALSQSHVVKHDNHVPVTPLIGSGTGCHLDAMAAVWQNHIGRNIQIKFKLRPYIHNRIANLFMEALRYQVGTILLELVPLFFLKSSGPLNCTFTCHGYAHNKRLVDPHDYSPIFHGVVSLAQGR